MRGGSGGRRDLGLQLTTPRVCLGWFLVVDGWRTVVKRVVSGGGDGDSWW
jgi:hypothetical protein